MSRFRRCSTRSRSRPSARPRLSNGLLNFSRTSGTEFQEIDLNYTIRETLTLLEHQFKTSQVEVDLALRTADFHTSWATLASCSKCSSTCS